jgi:hypothetical protein
MSEIDSVTRFQGRGVTLDCPVGWQLFDDGRNADMPVTIIVGASVSEGGFTPNVVVTDDTLDSGMTLAQWVQASVEPLQRVLAGFRLIDVHGIEIAGQLAAWRVACYAHKEWSLMMSQWLWLELGGRRGVTATATCTLQVYNEMEPVLTEIVKSYRRQGERS